jgi:hypothetical protein
MIGAAPARPVYLRAAWLLKSKPLFNDQIAL